MQRPVTAAMLILWVAPLFALQPDAKSLLRDAAARYRDAKSFRIEFETTITSSSPYSSGWSKQMYVVAVADHKYHWEGRGTGLRGVRINDGQSDWFYVPGMHEYSVQSADSTKPRLSVRGTAGGTTESWIKSAIHSLLHLDDDADASVMQREEVLRIAKAKIPCYVVHAVQSMSFREGTNSTQNNTYWIEKATRLVRKAVLSKTGPVSGDDDENDKTRTVEITYTRVDLDTAPDPSLFEFKPPADAYLIDDARQPISPPLSIGSPAPALKLTDKNGVSFDLAEFKGKVTLVDFWATWCGACLEEMKAIAQLPQSYSDNGLVIVSVDEDETSRRGDDYFSSQKFNWRNLHDTGEIHRRTWGVTAFPLLILVDRDGKIIWTDAGAGPNFLETLRSQLDKPELRLNP
ncbi:MAG: TlpA disulfide reductase family protein [Candidatus Sulfotelmatobacter sp.]|jgi:thiol-disulfide isomerase/thioredoxin